MGRKRKQSEKIIKNTIGEEIHIFDDGIRIKKISMFSRLPSGQQFCPNCHKPIVHKNNYWECMICNYSITDNEVQNGYGYPTEESSYDNDYGNIYDEPEGIPECCEECGGPYPDCIESCKIYD